MYGFVKKTPFKKADFFPSLFKRKLTSRQAHLWDNLTQLLRMLTSFLKDFCSINYEHKKCHPLSEPWLDELRLYLQ